MERTVFNVRPDETGWRIECQEREPAIVGDVRSAIIKAHQLAREECRRLGTPTAVAVRYGCGDALLSGYHG
jgi:hypothetical protein